MHAKTTILFICIHAHKVRMYMSIVVTEQVSAHVKTQVTSPGVNGDNILHYTSAMQPLV